MWRTQTGTNVRNAPRLKKSFGTCTKVPQTQIEGMWHCVIFTKGEIHHTSPNDMSCQTTCPLSYFIGESTNVIIMPGKGVITNHIYKEGQRWWRSNKETFSSIYRIQYVQLIIGDLMSKNTEMSKVCSTFYIIFIRRSYSWKTVIEFFFHTTRRHFFNIPIFL